MNLFLRTLLGNLLRALLGNRFPGTLPGTPLLANLFLETFSCHLWNPLACEPILGNLFLPPFLRYTVSKKRFPSKVRFPGIACKYGSKSGSQARSQEPFPSKVPSRNKARRNRFSSKRSQKSWFPSKVSRNRFFPNSVSLGSAAIPGTGSQEQVHKQDSQGR